MTLRLAHLSDSHIDADARVAAKILLDAQGQNVRFLDRIRCFRAAVDGAIERGCHLLVHSGDLFDANRPTPAEYCAAEEIFDAAVAKMPCVLIADNHGSVESSTERHAVEPLIGRHPNLRVSVRPEAHLIETAAGRVHVFTLPSPRRAIIASRDETRGLSPESVNAIIADKLRGILRGFTAQRVLGVPTILVAHIPIQGAWLTDLQRAGGFGSIALNPADLEGFDYVALGDFHGYQRVTDRAYYSGSTDRCSFNEEQQAKGWLCVTIHDVLSGGPRNVPMVERVDTPARRYLSLSPTQFMDFPVEEYATPYDDLTTLPIMRLHGTVSQEHYDALQPYLTTLREIPTFSEALEVTRETTARAAGMTADLSEEATMVLWHRVNNRTEDLTVLMAEHRRIHDGNRVGSRA